MRKNDAFVAKIVNTRLTKGFMAIFAPAESLPSPATLYSFVRYSPFFFWLFKYLTTKEGIDGVSRDKSPTIERERAARDFTFAHSFHILVAWTSRIEDLAK